jgi:hypothetical protein
MDFRLPFILLFAICAVVVCLIMSLSSDKPRSRSGSVEQEVLPDAKAVRMTKGLMCASWAATFTANGLFAAVRSVYPMRVRELAASGALTLFDDYRPALLDAVGPATAYSWLAFLLSLATVACFALLGATRAWQGRFSVLAAGQVAAAASFIGLGHTRSLAVMILCFAVVGANYGLCFFASLYYSLASAEAGHRRAAINEGALGAGGFAGGIGLGQAAQVIGISTAFQWTPLIVLPAVAVQFAVMRIADRLRP